MNVTGSWPSSTDEGALFPDRVVSGDENESKRLMLVVVGDDMRKRGILLGLSRAEREGEEVGVEGVCV